MKANPRSTKAWGDFQAFETLSDPQLQRMKLSAVSFVDDMLNARHPYWLSLLGTSGAGKTMLAKMIWRQFRTTLDREIDWPSMERTQGPSCPHGRIIRYHGGYINWGDAINNRMLRGDFDFLEDMRDYSFFVIDDIASEHERHRELSASKLYNVLEARLGKWTVLTANLSLEQIGTNLDTRIASRMLRNESVVVDVNVHDYNLRRRDSAVSKTFQDVKKIMQD